MRTVRFGAVFGALWLLGSCVPIDSEAPVSGSKQIQQLSGHEIVYLCDWATDYMGGIPSNDEEVDLGMGIVHRCPPLPDQDDNEERFVRFQYEDCPSILASEALNGCTITVAQFSDWIRDAADAPCEYHYLGNGTCEFIWQSDQEAVR